MNFAHLAMLAVALAGQGPPGGAAPAGDEPDFRRYIFMAYGAVLLLLLLFCLWSVVQVSGAERKLDHLRERLEEAPGGIAKERT